MCKAACPKCRIVFDSDLEYRMHWSHSHYGPAPAPLTQPVPVSNLEEKPLVAPVEEPKTAEPEEAPYSLAASREGLGELSPVLKDVHGNVIDGFHRLGENANWHTITVPTIDNPIKLELARLAVNYNRRKVAPEELTQRISFLVKAGLKPEDIAKATGISKATIYRHMPQDLKSDLSKKIIEGKSKDVARATYTNTPLPRQEPISLDERKPLEPASTPSCTPIAEPKPKIVQCEPEVIPEGTPICPVCEASMDLAEFEEVKRAVAIKYGKQIQTLLFPKV